MILNSKIKNQNFCLLLCRFTFLFLIFTFATFALPAFAQSPSPTAEPTKNVRDQLRERVEKKITEFTQKPRAFLGKITSVQDSSFIIDTSSGTRQIKITENTVIVQVGKEDLRIGNLVIALGTLTTKDVLEAKRILVIERLPETKKRAVWGIVENIEKDTFIIKHPKKDESWKVLIDTKTRVTAKVDTKIEKVSLDLIETEDRIIAVGAPVEGKTNTLRAKLIHVIPLPKSSPSPKPSPQ